MPPSLSEPKVPWAAARAATPPEPRGGEAGAGCPFGRDRRCHRQHHDRADPGRQRATVSAEIAGSLVGGALASALVKGAPPAAPRRRSTRPLALPSTSGLPGLPRAAAVATERFGREGTHVGPGAQGRRSAADTLTCDQLATPRTGSSQLNVRWWYSARAPPSTCSPAPSALVKSMYSLGTVSAS